MKTPPVTPTNYYKVLIHILSYFYQEASSCFHYQKQGYPAFFTLSTRYRVYPIRHVQCARTQTSTAHAPHVQIPAPLPHYSASVNFWKIKRIAPICLPDAISQINSNNCQHNFKYVN